MNSPSKKSKTKSKNSKVYNSIVTGLRQAIDYEKGVENGTKSKIVTKSEK